MGYCYGQSGKTGDAERLLGELQERSETTYIPAVSSAMTYIGMSDAGRAVEWLNRAYDEECGVLVWLSLDPIYDTLRSDPPLPSPPPAHELPRVGVGVAKSEIRATCRIHPWRCRRKTLIG